MNLILTLRQRLLLLLCIVLVAFFILSLISGVTVWKFGTTTPAMRIITVLQDVILFILPAVGTALIVTRRPAALLALDVAPQPNMLFLAILTLIAAIPAMNFVIWLNAEMPLPDSIARSLKAMEAQAENTIQILCGKHNIPNLIVSVLIMGVFAGLSEEILFRGGLQRLLVTGGVNPHAAIWVTAAVFSLMHMQAYGFVPRMLLGAFFGYLLLWSRSLWVPIIMHALNNTIYVVAQYTSHGDEEGAAIDSFGQGKDYFFVAISVAVTALLIYHLWRIKVKD